ncbi:hypothetical protein [Pseudomonas sp.]|uniref:hypothetical protein n=1 Tax=Pseudomonas sp. TaxID=306 RepID=UPI0032671695
MNWKAISKNCMSSEEGYLISRFAVNTGYGYTVRCPKAKIIHAGNDVDKAKAACVEHLNSQKVAA